MTNDSGHASRIAEQLAMGMGDDGDVEPDADDEDGLDDRDLTWGEPVDARRWHVFDGPRSLCGNWMYSGATQPVIGDETFHDGSDCKECCRKAGLLDGDSDE